MTGSTVRITDRRNLYYRKVCPYLLADPGAFSARYKRGLLVRELLQMIQRQQHNKGKEQ